MQAIAKAILWLLAARPSAPMSGLDSAKHANPSLTWYQEKVAKVEVGQSCSGFEVHMTGLTFLDGSA